MAPHAPYLRGAPPGLLFHWERGTVEAGLNFTLTTRLGAIDRLGEIAGGRTHQDLLPHSEHETIFGFECLCLSLGELIEVKRAAGRGRDLQALADLEALLEERRRGREP